MNENIKYSRYKKFRKLLGNSFFSFLDKPMNILESTYGESYLSDAEYILTCLERAYPTSDTIEWAVNGFIKFNQEILLSEKEFLKTGEYSAKPSDFDQVNNEYYANPEVMADYYLSGLYATYFAWPHHYQLLQWYRSSFLSSVNLIDCNFEDWGTGHGLFSLELLNTGQIPRSMKAFDISQHSLEFAKRLISANHSNVPIEFIQGDIFDIEAGAADIITCCELLEHLPKPQALLQQLTKALKPGGHAFVTGAINAPQPDHIYLFKSQEEILSLVSHVGLHVVDKIEVVHPSRLDQSQPPTVLIMHVMTQE